MDALKLQTLELHWAESFFNTGAEHNVIVVTARGQAFEKAILLDNWRYSGHLVWTQVAMDPEYHWTENKSERALRLGEQGMWLRSKYENLMSKTKDHRSSH